MNFQPSVLFLHSSAVDYREEGALGAVTSDQLLCFILARAVIIYQCSRTCLI
jgi:hypothetical protein